MIWILQHFIVTYVPTFKMTWVEAVDYKSVPPPPSKPPPPKNEIHRVGNPDDVPTQNCLPQNCL